MLRLLQRTLVGQATENQYSGVLIHPTQDIVVLYAVSSTSASQAYLTYCQEQLDHEQPATTLEFHQLLDRCISTSERMDVSLSLIGVATFGERIALAAYNGNVWLKRGTKVGQILSAESTLQILEGKTQADDIYALFTKEAATLSAVIQNDLAKADSSNALELVEDPQLRAAVHETPTESQMGVTIVTVVETEQTLQSHDVPSAVTPTTETALAFDEEPAKPKPALLQATQNIGNLFGGVRRGAQSAHNEVAQLFSQDVYVRQRQRRSVGKVLAVLVVLAILIAAGAFYWNKKQNTQQQEVNAMLQPYQQQLNNIKALSGDPVLARQKTEALIADLDAQTQKSDQPKYLQVASINELNAVKAYYQSISGQEEQAVLPTFFDLRLVQSNFLASRVDATQDTLFFLDVGQKKVLALNIEKKQPTILPIGDYPDIRALVADDKYLYFLGEGLFKFTLSGTDVAKIVENPDDTIKGGQVLGLFDKYLYVLNKDQNNIFRYDTEDDKLDSKPASWVTSSQGIDFAQVQSFSIDGDVWLTTQAGGIKKLSSGKPADFTITGLKEAFSTPISLFTKPDLQNLYVLEPAKNRVVVLNKEGQFVKEVKSNNLAGATAVVASEKAQKAFALSGSIVYELGL